jgi:hypothetical protein
VWCEGKNIDARSWAAASSSYSPRGGSLQTCCMTLCTVTCTSAQCPWRDGCPGGFSSLGRLDGEFQLPRAAWRLLCLSGDDFKGGLDRRSCLVVVHTLIRGCTHACLRVLLREELWMHRRQRGDVLSAQGATASGMAPQCRGWSHSAGDGGEDVFCAFRAVAPPGLCTVRCPYTLRGCPHDLSRGSPSEEDGSRRHTILE